MELKDKLNLLWKYLFLVVVIVFGILLVTRHPGYCRGDRHFKARGYMHEMGMPHKGMMGPGELKVIKEVEDGDTNVVVWVNGKKIDNPHEFMKMHQKGICQHCGKMHKSGMKCWMMDDDDDDDDDDD